MNRYLVTSHFTSTNQHALRGQRILTIDTVNHQTLPHFLLIITNAEIQSNCYNVH